MKPANAGSVAVGTLYHKSCKIKSWKIFDPFSINWHRTAIAEYLYLILGFQNKTLSRRLLVANIIYRNQLVD